MGPAPQPPPAAPWRLGGECLLAWVRAPRELRALLPPGIAPLPGPAALVAVAYDRSPIGRYLELSLGLPARLGLRPALCVVLQVVSAPDARRVYRSAWGLPTDLGSLTWEADGDERIMRCEAPALELRGVPVGPRFPAAVPVRSVQRRRDGPVVVPRRFLALVRLARTTLTLAADAGDTHPLAGLEGDHPGALMAGVRILARPARHPAGLWSSLRAPLVVPEPALAGATVTPRTGA